MTATTLTFNPMFFNFKQQNLKRIEYLQQKIREQEKEIEDLKMLISLLSHEKNYDC